MKTSGSGRAKRVTDPLDDEVKARLRGYFSSSGSEHDAESSDLVDEFFFSENVELDDFSDAWKEGNDRSSGGFSDGEEFQSFDAPAVGMIRDLVNWGKYSAADEQNRRDLAANVSRSAEKFSDLKRKNRSAFLRAVMASLREIGFNAGICKSRWENGGVLAGSYEYIDVVNASNARYIVDLDFAGEFDIARPTPEYGRISGELPRIIVTRPEILRQILRILAEAARRSLRHRELSIPPWRKTGFMQAKWLGPYLRTLNYSPSSSPSSSFSVAAAPPPRWGEEVKCRLVGFDTPAAFIPTAVIPPA